MRHTKSPEIFRNYGFWDEATQRALCSSCIAIAGTGGAGYLFALELARMGVSKFILADPEAFDQANINRVMGARAETLGKNKALMLREDLLAINPEAMVKVFEEGVNEDNISAFLREADLVLNAIEVAYPHLSVMLCREARTRIRVGAPDPIAVLDIQYIGHGGTVTSFSPSSNYTYEKHMGLRGKALDELSGYQLDARKLITYVPLYGDIRTLAAVMEGAPMPSNMIGTGVTTQLGVAEYLKHIRKRFGIKTKKPVTAPKIRWYDAYTGKAGSTRFPNVTRNLGLFTIFVKNVLGLHEPASYSKSERVLRGDKD